MGEMLRSTERARGPGEGGADGVFSRRRNFWEAQLWTLQKASVRLAVKR
jgi:hypothetical protein